MVRVSSDLPYGGEEGPGGEGNESVRPRFLGEASGLPH